MAHPVRKNSAMPRCLTRHFSLPEPIPNFLKLDREQAGAVITQVHHQLAAVDDGVDPDEPLSLSRIQNVCQDILSRPSFPSARGVPDASVDTERKVGLLIMGHPVQLKPKFVQRLFFESRPV